MMMNSSSSRFFLDLPPRHGPPSRWHASALGLASTVLGPSRAAAPPGRGHYTHCAYIACRLRVHCIYSAYTLHVLCMCSACMCTKGLTSACRCRSEGAPPSGRGQ